MTKKKKKISGSAVSSRLVRRPIQRAGWFFILPMTIAFCIGFVWPFIQGIFLSFCKFTVVDNWEWIGFSNYLKIFNDQQFRYSFIFTAVFAIVSLVLINVIAFTIAYFLTKGIKGSNLFRTVFFMPNLIGGIVLGYIWLMIFDGILKMLHKNPLVLNTKYGFWGLIILVCWQQIGYMMIIYIAGLQSVPEDILEAAKIDGASSWKTLFKIIIPNVMPSITICTFLSLTNGFKLFDQNLVLTGGQPFDRIPGTSELLHTTEMLALNIVNRYKSTSPSAGGTTQAEAVLFFILVACIGLIQLRATRNKEVQQ